MKEKRKKMKERMKGRKGEREGRKRERMNLISRGAPQKYVIG